MAVATSVPAAGVRSESSKLLDLFSALLDLEVSPSCALYTSSIPDAEKALRSFAAVTTERTYLDEFQTRHGRAVVLCNKADHRRLVHVYVDDLPLDARLRDRWDELCRMEPELELDTLPRDQKIYAASLRGEAARVYLRMVAKRKDAAMGGGR